MIDNVEKVEKDVLSSLIRTSKNFDKVFSLLQPTDFSSIKLQKLFVLCKNMYDEGTQPRETTIISRILSTDKTNVIPISLVTELSDSYVTDAHLDEDINIIIDYSTRRRMSKLGAHLTKSLKDGHADVRDTIAEFEKDFLEITKNRTVGDFKNIGEVANLVVQKAHNIKNQQISITGTPTGFKVLDDMTAGFQPGDLVILAARPGMGKTALALNMALNASKSLNNDECVVFFSLEMPEHQLVTRLLSIESMVDAWKFKKGQFTQKDTMNVEAAKDLYQTINFKIDYTPGLELSELSNKVKTLSTTTKPKLIVLDYLQLLSARGYGSSSRLQEVSAISRKLKILGGEIGCPIIALSQLSRNVESREDKRPILSDLRESGAIEQDADMILFLYREDYYNNKDTAEERSDNIIMECNVAKNRHGAQQVIKLLFQKNFGRFDNL